MPAPPTKPATEQEKAPFVVEGPPEEEFWDRYNRRLEFPLAAVAAVLFHVVVLVGLVYGLLALMAGDDSPGPKLELAAVGGLDDAGEGSAGSGGKEDPDVIKDVSPERTAKDLLPTPQALADAKENVKKIVLDDPSGNIPISSANAAAYSQLDESLRKKLLGVGSNKGAGPGAGRGDDGSAGTGPGGGGADSTRARGLRWVLRFKVANGRDYLDQLRAMGAEILVPIPPGEKDCLLFPDLNNTGTKRMATDNDFKRLGSKIKFGDTRRDAVAQVAGGARAGCHPEDVLGVLPEGAGRRPRPQGDELPQPPGGGHRGNSVPRHHPRRRVRVRGGRADVQAVTAGPGTAAGPAAAPHLVLLGERRLATPPAEQRPGRPRSRGGRPAQWSPFFSPPFSGP
jgi:hypothetical protein